MPQIKNLKKAAERILKAIKNKERIILYGDADLDGIASVIILQETIQLLDSGCQVTVYFPDREKEGYGINESALKFLSAPQQSTAERPALFIVLDTGIGNVKEVEIAKELGFEVVIIEHHQVIPPLPRASIIVDPKQKSDKYSFKHLACAGVVYNLSKIFAPHHFSQKSGEGWRPERFLELVALATIYDRMPLIGENEKLVRDGILALKYTKRPGLKALMVLHPGLSAEWASWWGVEEVRQKLVSPLAAATVFKHLNEAYFLLIEKDALQAKKMAKNLCEKAEQKKEEIKKIFGEVEARMNLCQPIVFEGSSCWPVILLGPVASKICQKYNMPCFLFQKGRAQSRGGVRAPAGLDALKAMGKCSDFLESYGGHSPAAGFSIKNENLEKFRECLIKYFKKP